MTDTTPKFDPIPRLQQIAETIRERGADTFDAPATAAYYIDCAIKEIERLRRDYSCICNEMRRMMEERDEARREVCELRTDIGFSRPIASHIVEFAASRGWNCFKEDTNG